MDVLALAVKAVSTAAVVVTASVIAERVRPVIAAMVLSLPVSAGPAYVLLALQHDAPFIAAASLATIPVNIATVAIVLGYAAVARTGRGVAASYATGMVAWLGTIALLTPLPWTFVTAMTLVVIVFAAAIVATRRWRHAVGSRPATRWYDVPLRATFVAALVVAVVSLSDAIGPTATGVLAGFPVTYSSFMLLMHHRLGGPVVAAAMINGLTMLIGFAGGLAALHLAAAAGQVWLGIGLFFVIPVVYALGVLAWLNRRRAVRAPR